MKTPAIVLALCILAVPATAWADGDDEPRTIEVTGKAEVRYPAEYVVLWASVRARGESAQTIQSTVMTKVSGVLQHLQDAGVPPDDLSTSFVSLRDVSWEEVADDDCPPAIVPPRYEASTQIRIVLRDLSRYDAVVTELLERGLNEIHGITFESSLTAEKGREARVLAVNAARDKARYLAAELEQDIGRPLAVKEVATRSWYDRSAAMSNAVMVTKSGSFDDGTSSLLAGELKATSEVNVVFELVDPR